jgi:hypothetical protein
MGTDDGCTWGDWVTTVGLGYWVTRLLGYYTTEVLGTWVLNRGITRTESVPSLDLIKQIEKPPSLETKHPSFYFCCAVCAFEPDHHIRGCQRQYEVRHLAAKPSHIAKAGAPIQSFLLAPPPPPFKSSRVLSFFLSLCTHSLQPPNLHLSA